MCCPTAILCSHLQKKTIDILKTVITQRKYLKINKQWYLVLKLCKEKPLVPIGKIQEITDCADKVFKNLEPSFLS